MNKRARVRLIVVGVAIAVIGVAAYFVLQGSGQDILTVTQISDGAVEPGVRVKVTGMVIGESWDGSANPMRFDIRDDGTTGPDLAVVYPGTVPSGFGEKTSATLTGVLGAGGVFEASEMLTQCPSKYESQEPTTVAAILGDVENATGVTVRITGVVVQEPVGNMLKLADSPDGTQVLDVTIPGPIEGLVAGTTVEGAGQLGSNGVFKATGLTVTRKASAP